MQTHNIDGPIILERWNGTTWYETMLSPFTDIAAVKAHIKKYTGWHYTTTHPFRLQATSSPASDRVFSLD